MNADSLACVGLWCDGDYGGAERVACRALAAYDPVRDAAGGGFPGGGAENRERAALYESPPTRPAVTSRCENSATKPAAFGLQAYRPHMTLR